MVRPVSADRLVTPASRMPQGTMRSNQLRSQLQLSAKPCIATPRDTRMPIAATLRSSVLPGPRPPVSHTPLRPSTRVVATPGPAQARISASSMARTYAITSTGSASVHDRVADELARPVPGDLPAAVHVDDRYARVGERAVELARPPAGRVDGRVLQHQARVGNVPADPPFVQPPLEIPAVEVGNRVGAEACPGKNKLAIHAVSLSGQPARQPGAGPARHVPAGSPRLDLCRHQGRGITPDRAGGYPERVR